LIGKLKQKLQITPFQPDRWSLLLKDRVNKGGLLKLDSEFVHQVFKLIHKESLGKQGEIMND
jgi:chorismate mutase